jgi:hypothetical protein
MKKNLALFMTIFMIAVTSLMIFASFYAIPVTRTNFILITALSVLGYITAMCYYQAYREIKKGGEDYE